MEPLVIWPEPSVAWRYANLCGAKMLIQLINFDSFPINVAVINDRFRLAIHAETLAASGTIISENVSFNVTRRVGSLNCFQQLLTMHICTVILGIHETCLIGVDVHQIFSAFSFFQLQFPQ